MEVKRAEISATKRKVVATALRGATLPAREGQPEGRRAQGQPCWFESSPRYTSIEQLRAILAGPSYAPPMTTNKPPTLADAFAEEDAKATQAFQATQTPGTPEYAREQARLAAERDRRAAEPDVDLSATDVTDEGDATDEEEAEHEDSSDGQGSEESEESEDD